MSKTLEDLEAYKQRKKDRRDDEARNMNLCMEMGEVGLAQAQCHLDRANALSRDMDIIDHCITLVKRNEME